tara:strand:- start:1307 stop:1465 length:159 start_codon:yes stop_codon:yes gene_type:complete
MQTPIVKIGTQFPAGKVVAIRKDGVDLETPKDGVKTFSLTQIERFINVKRAL